MPRLVLVNPSNRNTLYGDYGWQPLSLGYLAGATPAGWEIEIADEILRPLTDRDLSAEIVALTAFTTQATRAYEVAARAKALGAHTVIGGVHATFLPDEAARFVDTVVTGEADLIWTGAILDFERGAIRARYDGGRPALDRPIVPRRELFTKGAYTYASMQTTRGCPLDCSFCSVTAFNGRSFRMSDEAWAVAEISRIPEERVLIVDDDFNGFSSKARRRAIDVCNAISARAPKKRWMTQVTLNFGDDDELPAAAARAGCAAVFIGFESLSPADLATVAKKRYRGGEHFIEAVRRIRGAGIAVIGSFILGIDGQDLRRTVDETLEFLDRSAMDAFNPTILTPLPGTRDFVKYSQERRLLLESFPEDWACYNLATPTVRSPGFTAARLYREYQRWMEFFDPACVLSRARRTRGGLGEAAAEAAYLWNRAWSAHYRRATLPRSLPADPPVPETTPASAPVS